MEQTQDVLIGKSAFDKLRELAARVEPGMRRWQVERLFPRSSGGIQGPLITIYNENRGMRVEVQYDNKSSFPRADDIVMAPAKAFMTLDW